LDLLAVERVPRMARPSYLLEVRHLFLWGIFAGMFEGTVSAVVVSKTFDAGPWLITTVMATPMLANVLGMVWGSVITGRRKIPIFVMLGMTASVVIASVAFTPMTPTGGYIFLAQVLAARILLSGCLTVRSSLWKHNYPANRRGQIAARLQLVRFSMGIGIVALASSLFDVNPQIYVFVYPIAGVIGAASVWMMRPMRVRGEAAELAEIRAGRQGQRRTFNPLRDVIDVFSNDRDYRKYCVAMMFLGFANIMVMPLMVIIVTKRLDLSYFISGGLLEILPRVIMMASLIPWAHLFDKWGVVRFRVLNAAAWTASSAFAGVAAWIILRDTAIPVWLFMIAMAAIAVSRVFEGAGKGGGSIAWNIGHLHFAEPARAEVYMGAHVFLTGLRGLTAPFVGTWLYTYYGPLAFGVAVALALIGLLVFRSLAREQHDAQAAAHLKTEASNDGDFKEDTDVLLSKGSYSS